MSLPILGWGYPQSNIGKLNQQAIQKKKGDRNLPKINYFCVVKYKQLTSEQRSQIFAYLQDGIARKVICVRVGISQSTLSRELRRNCGKHGNYTWQFAYCLAMERRERICRNRKIPAETINKALSYLTEQQWSPEQISGYLKLHGTHISHERIYQEIRADRTGELRKHCRHKMKYRHRSSADRINIPNRVSIHERPPEADGRRFGDWEMDLVIGKEHKSAVLTMIERRTNMFLQTKIPSKKPHVVAMAAWRLLFPYRKNVLTITTDNGSEFMNHQWLSRKIGAGVYFADPFCSGQKGAVENANKLFRQYFPKGTDFNNITQEELDRVQRKINQRPRRKLGFCSPKQIFFELLS